MVTPRWARAIPAGTARGAREHLEPGQGGQPAGRWLQAARQQLLAPPPASPAAPRGDQEHRRQHLAADGVRLDLLARRGGRRVRRLHDHRQPRDHARGGGVRLTRPELGERVARAVEGVVGEGLGRVGGGVGARRVDRRVQAQVGDVERFAPTRRATRSRSPFADDRHRCGDVRPLRVDREEPTRGVRLRRQRLRQRRARRRVERAGEHEGLEACGRPQEGVHDPDVDRVPDPAPARPAVAVESQTPSVTGLPPSAAVAPSWYQRTARTPRPFATATAFLERLWAVPAAVRVGSPYAGIADNRAKHSGLCDRYRAGVPRDPQVARVATWGCRPSLRARRRRHGGRGEQRRRATSRRRRARAAASRRSQPGCAAPDPRHHSGCAARPDHRIRLRPVGAQPLPLQTSTPSATRSAIEPTTPVAGRGRSRPARAGSTWW